METPQSQPPALPALPTVLRRAINLLVVHCSATASGCRIAGSGPSAIRTAANVIDGWHHLRGFARSDVAIAKFNSRLKYIGYHYVIDVDGYVLTGRHLDEIGAHVAGHNAQSIGICMVGGVEPQGRYTPEQWASLAALVQQLDARLSLAARPGRAVVGHRDLSPDTNKDGKVSPAEWLKTCPGFDVATWLGSGMRPLPQHVCPSVKGTA